MRRALSDERGNERLSDCANGRPSSQARPSDHKNNYKFLFYLFIYVLLFINRFKNDGSGQPVVQVIVQSSQMDIRNQLVPWGIQRVPLANSPPTVTA